MSSNCEKHKSYTSNSAPKRPVVTVLVPDTMRVDVVVKRYRPLAHSTFILVEWGETARSGRRMSEPSPGGGSVSIDINPLLPEG